MNRVFKVLAIAFMGLAIMAPDASAQRPGNRGRGSSSSQSQRPSGGGNDHGASSRSGASNHGSQRPSQPGNNQRPQQNHGASQRPAQPGNNQRPQQNHGASQRPAQPGNNQRPQPQAPAHNYGPGPVHHPGPGPHHDHHYGHVPPHAPYRPYMPANRPFHRPVPPPHFHPVHGCPVIGTILGVALGTSINITMNYLLNQGIAVAGYANDVVYLNNVNQLNMLWPNATLYYDTYGGLANSEFVYSTPYYDMNRYNMAYRMLVNNYGMPVSSVQLAGGGVEVAWFGFDGQFVRLQYLPGSAFDGSYRYYTTLSFGR